MTPLQSLFKSLNSNCATEIKLTILITGDYRTCSYTTVSQGEYDVYARRTAQRGPEGTITLCIRPSGDYLTLPVDHLSEECQRWVREMDRKAAAQRSDAETEKAAMAAMQLLTLKSTGPKRLATARKDASRIDKVPKVHLKRTTRIMRFALCTEGKKVERWVTVPDRWVAVIDLTGDDEDRGAIAVDQATTLLSTMEIGQ